MCIAMHIYIVKRGVPGSGGGGLLTFAPLVQSSKQNPPYTTPPPPGLKTEQSPRLKLDI